MGMYTEFHFNSRLKQDVPKEIVDTLTYMLEETTAPKLPDHELFKTARWEFMLRSDSYYFDADTLSTLRYDEIAEAYVLCIRCNLKNYNSEIEKFIKWIMPYLDRMDGDFLGFLRYEEDELPTLIFQNEPLFNEPLLVVKDFNLNEERPF